MQETCEANSQLRHNGYGVRVVFAKFVKRTRQSQKISRTSGSMLRTKYKSVLNRARGRCWLIPSAETNLSGRFEGPKKNDPAAINSPKHIRQRCRATRFALRTPRFKSMRMSPMAASRHTDPMKN